MQKERTHPASILVIYSPPPHTQHICVSFPRHRDGDKQRARLCYLKRCKIELPPARRAFACHNISWFALSDVLPGNQRFPPAAVPPTTWRATLGSTILSDQVELLLQAQNVGLLEAPRRRRNRAELWTLFSFPPLPSLWVSVDLRLLPLPWLHFRCS